MEAVCSSEITVYTHQTARSHNPEDHFLNKPVIHTHKRFDISTSDFSFYPTFCACFSQILWGGFPAVIYTDFLLLARYYVTQQSHPLCSTLFTIWRRWLTNCDFPNLFLCACFLG